jgi:hypothetical protein
MQVADAVFNADSLSPSRGRSAIVQCHRGGRWMFITSTARARAKPFVKCESDQTLTFSVIANPSIRLHPSSS